MLTFFSYELSSPSFMTEALTAPRLGRATLCGAGESTVGSSSCVKVMKRDANIGTNWRPEKSELGSSLCVCAPDDEKYPVPNGYPTIDT